MALDTTPTNKNPPLLIDVRTPSEFSTGYLSLQNTPAINIEYQDIHQLPHILRSQHGIEVSKDDDITLYCRSGRRSGIALGVLRELGYARVRNIGGFEEAREVLEREERERVQKGNAVGEVGFEGRTEEDEAAVARRREAREKQFAVLLQGLRAES
ncbi:uncharacterized protein EI97DRAFT_436270 [Westerdykella ornata]|uniref:Rhodanese domain-containing protein n=1 Tax=Westerdykella ornata TaxID=318751 RepID=A0A6A6JB50_WESOR|nr:uncharacterized protein EI97DRAFT_436270 [Westerdykella ornata]KAF2273208.1 hypothetical protein EI97DRAFT_436270 [Westerdykella ornata]